MISQKSEKFAGRQILGDKVKDTCQTEMNQ